MPTSTVVGIEHLLELLQPACAGATLCEEPNSSHAATIELLKPVDLPRVDELLQQAPYVDPISRSELVDRWRVKLYKRQVPRTLVTALDLEDLGAGFWLYRMP